MSEGREMTTACQGAPAHPLEVEHILSKILVRLPPLPSSLPRASLVCKQWRRVVTDRHFHRSFLAHHKKAPLLGFLCEDFTQRIFFSAALDPPNRIPAARFSGFPFSEHNRILGCHHGRLLALNYSSGLVVWDPITGDRRRHIDVPHQMFKRNEVYGQKGVVVCASKKKDHVHGACHSEPFQVVITGINTEGVIACVYSSETCTWGNLISLSQPELPDISFYITVQDVSLGSLVGNSVYWTHVDEEGAFLEFDLLRQSLAIIDAPPDASLEHYHQSIILPADGGGLSFVVLSGLSVHVWKRISDGHGVAGWLLENTVELSNLLPLKPREIEIHRPLRIVGCDEDDNMIFRSDNGTLYSVHLKTLQFKELPEKIRFSMSAHPFSSFYTAGMHPETGMRGDKKCVNNGQNSHAG